MNVSAITASLADFVRNHKTAFNNIASRESQLLELAAVIGVQEHYRSNGYQIAVEGTTAGTFVVKTGTRGHPSRYSRICASKDGAVAEVHMNLLVRSAHDEGIYCVDVGVVVQGV